MKKICLIMVLMLVCIPTKVNADTGQEISYREIRTNEVIVNGGSSLSDTIDSGIEKHLYPNEVWTPLTSSYIEQDALENPFVLYPEPQYGYVYYRYVIAYEDGDTFTGNDKEISFEELVSKKNKKIDEVIFYYSHGGQLNVSYKLDTVDGIELKEPKSLLGRVEFNHIDSNNNEFHSFGEEYSIDTEIVGYRLKETIGMVSSTFDLSRQEVILVYEEITEEPVEPVNPTEPKEPSDPVEVPEPKDNEEVEEVLGVNENPHKTQSKQESLPATGVSNNYLGYVIFLMGLGVIYLEKKLNNNKLSN